MWIEVRSRLRWEDRMRSDEMRCGGWIDGMSVNRVGWGDGSSDWE